MNGIWGPSLLLEIYRKRRKEDKCYRDLYNYERERWERWRDEVLASMNIPPDLVQSENSNYASTITNKFR